MNMTPEQRRELDAWIAQYLWGWEWWQRANEEAGKTVIRRAIYPPLNSGWIRFNFSESVFTRCNDMSVPRFSDWDKVCAEEDWRKENRRIGLPRFTTSPADAFAVQIKCAEKAGALRIHKIDDGAWIVHALCPSYNGLFRVGETLEIALCEFAKALYGKADQ